MDNKKNKGSKELIVDMEEITENEKSIKDNLEQTKPPIYQSQKESDNKQNILKNQALINAFNLDQDTSEDESDNQEEIESEPKLKYQIINSESLSDILKRDNISTITASDRFLAVGTHNGMIHILDLNGNSVKRFKCHSATINQISIDDNGEYVASASDDGRVVINGLYTTDANSYTYKRPVKSVALEPNFSKKSSRQLVSGGTAEQLVLSGKGWFGNRDTVLFSGEGPVRSIKWRNDYIAWANDNGISVYDINSESKIGTIQRPKNSPRAELFKCHLYWKSDNELICGWADNIKVIQIKETKSDDVLTALTSSVQKYLEVIYDFKTDYSISGIATLDDSIILIAFIIDKDELKDIDVLVDTPKKRKKSQPPEIRVINYDGVEIAADVISMQKFERFKSNDYHLEHIVSENTYYISSPKTIILAKPRDLEDHIEWLLEKKNYEEALIAVEQADSSYGGRSIHDIVDIGLKYITSLIEEKRYSEAAAVCPKILRQNGKLWEEWIITFNEADKLLDIIPYIPHANPQLNPSIYELVLSYLLKHDKVKFYNKIEQWPSTIYNISEIIVLVEAELEKDSKNDILLSTLADLYTYNKQFDMTLSYYLQIYRPNALDLIKKHNLYSMLEPLIVLMMKYDEHFVESRLIKKQQKASLKNKSKVINGTIKNGITSKTSSMTNSNTTSNITSNITSTVDSDNEEDTKKSGNITPRSEKNFNLINKVVEETFTFTPLQKIREAVKGDAVKILVENTDRILISQVVNQLYPYPKYLHIYLDALLKKDFHEGYDYHKLQIELYAEYDYPRLLSFLRTSNYYSLENAYKICEARDLVPEMVYLLGQMGNNKEALNLIISRLGDVQRAIEFAQQQNDPDLWEDLINYSMDKPKFIVGLLENVSSYIDPIKLIRRIPEQMEIPGLKNTLIKVMQDFGVQMSLREGCEKILISDTIELFEQLYNAQRRGMLFKDSIECSICNNEIITDITDPSDSTIIVFFCRHWFHEKCLQSSQNIAYLMNSKAIKMENNQEITKKMVLAKAIEAVYVPLKLNLNSSSLNQFNDDQGEDSLFKSKRRLNKSSLFNDHEDSYSERRGVRVIKPTFIKEDDPTMEGYSNQNLFSNKSLYCPICQSANLHGNVSNQHHSIGSGRGGTSSLTMNSSQLKQYIRNNSEPRQSTSQNTNNNIKRPVKTSSLRI
ncbi:vacuolar protein sorting-associated protein 41 [Piromyces finnis]|uniref:Vacuolar protein sorting-associated protein 41 homolog n=1 Tax=Piromyces finnis TaxID=1754191 RepID=A0A1Y1UY10_9FUNG|nr:vacuolar protein sorting-associated protein 41 [Piromyces finnis]|eukprot:ORX43267.1 vacuolar protein sorting-associated protein 41 [Piromyces finnis]